MLTICDTQPTHNCAGWSRREFLRVGALGMGGLSLAGMLRQQAAAANLSDVVTGRSVVFLFLNGGPSHIESFDPKMSAPSEVRAIFGEIPTRLPGITFGSHFPQLAARADRISILRSYGSGNSGHTYQQVASGNNATKATMGALFSRVVGTNHAESGMPTNVLVLPEAIRPELKLGNNFETGALPTLTHPGGLGESYAAFNPQGGSQLTTNMQLKLTRNRFDDRQSLLQGLDRLKRAADAGGLAGTDRYQQQAFDIITGGVADAFDLSSEDPATIAKYDTSHLFRQQEVSRWNDMRRASNLLGKQMLMARRLCEAGCGFVTVSDCGWDHHSNNNSPKGLRGFSFLAPQVDHAVAAFIDDCAERGLTDKILLVVTGEMGRTPRINGNGGRDHYGELTPLLFAGGGLPMGRVIGRSDHHATKATTRAYRPQHMLSTIMHSLFDIGELRILRGVPSDVRKSMTDGDPITELV